MRRLIGSLKDHAFSFLDHLKIDKEAFDTEGLGMQPLSSTRHISQRDARTLGRRMYRIGQWTEILQGSDWIAVRPPFTSHCSGVNPLRILLRRFSGITVKAPNLMRLGELKLTMTRCLVGGLQLSKSGLRDHMLWPRLRWPSSKRADTIEGTRSR